jgi:hypothetical protein
MAAATTVWDPRIYFGLPSLYSLEGAGPSDVVSGQTVGADDDKSLGRERLVLDTVGAAKTEHLGLGNTRKICDIRIHKVKEANVVLAALKSSRNIGEEICWTDRNGAWGERNAWWTRFRDPTTLALTEWRIWK